MNRKFYYLAMVCLLSMMFFSACKQRFSGYNSTQDGLYYKFYSQNPTAVQPKLTDFLKVEMACYLADTLYYDWHKSKSDVYAQLTEPHFPGDLQSAYAMMHVGDSASFYIKADSIAIKYYEKDPATVGLKSDDYFRYEVKLVEVKTKEEFQADIDQMKYTIMEKSEAALFKYIAENNITVHPTESGIYIIPLEKGYGRCPVSGEQVEIDFSASLLNGQLVGSTFDSPEKFSFILGQGYVIDGWEEIVPKMRLGERVKAIIPFDMAYGEQSYGNVPAYSNLIYEIKLLKITTVDELQKQAEQARKALKADSEKAFAEYLKTNSIMDHTESGLYYSKSVTTKGESPQVGKTARIKYVASLIDGTLLGNSDQLGDYYDVAYGKNKVLKGLEEGIGLMKVGEKARFVIPYFLAYGENPYEKIPAYSNLVFDVELLELLDPDQNQ